MPLRDYQQKAVNDILTAFKTHRKVLFQLATGGGKTFTFSYLAKRFSERKDTKVHILVNRQELVEQTYKTLVTLGVNAGMITAKQRKYNPSHSVYVGMVETVYRRNLPFEEVGFVIIDECHRAEFDKLLPKYNGYILGTTATPVRLKRNKFYKCSVCGSEGNEICCGQECDEWTSPFSMSQIYDTIVTGVGIQDLIDKGNLVKDVNHVFTPYKVDELQVDSKGEYTDDSLTAVYANHDQIEGLYQSYMTHCKGKKTMIFCNNTKTSQMVYDYFEDQDVNILSYDSKNGGNRKDIVKRFDKERDIVLTNVNVFTTGFDVTDVECIIVYRATKSLALWLQIVGRGARPTDKILKEYFTVLDFGGNVDQHFKWSERRDWEHIFYYGYGKKKSKKKDILDFWECDNCGAFNNSDVDPCESCGTPRIKKKAKEKNAVKGNLIAVDDYPPPTAAGIITWTKQNQQDKNFAYKVMYNKILDLFKFYEVSKNDYITRREKYEARVKQIIRPIYFAIIKSDIPANNKRTLNYVYNKCITKIEDYYGK